MNKLLIYYYLGLLFLFALTIYTYAINPIRYSKTLSPILISNNTLYWYIHVLLLILISAFSINLEKIRPEMPSFWAAIPLLFGVFALNILHDTPVEDDGSFNSPPKNLVLNKSSMIKRLIFTLLIFIIYICFYIFVEEYHHYIIPMFVCVIIYIYLIYKQKKYTRLNYKLPKTWRN